MFFERGLIDGRQGRVEVFGCWHGILQFLGFFLQFFGFLAPSLRFFVGVVHPFLEFSHIWGLFFHLFFGCAVAEPAEKGCCGESEDDQDGASAQDPHPRRSFLLGGSLCSCNGSRCRSWLNRSRLWLAWACCIFHRFLVFYLLI